MPPLKTTRTMGGERHPYFSASILPIIIAFTGENDIALPPAHLAFLCLVWPLPGGGRLLPSPLNPIIQGRQWVWAPRAGKQLCHHFLLPFSLGPDLLLSKTAFKTFCYLIVISITIVVLCGALNIIIPFLFLLAGENYALLSFLPFRRRFCIARAYIAGGGRDLLFRGALPDVAVLILPHAAKRPVLLHWW